MGMRIQKVRKDSQGDITDVMINGNVLGIDEAILLARDGKIEGVNVAESRNGRKYLRSNPDGEHSNNLDNLPAF